MVRIEFSNLKELPDFNRTGHTCANLDGDLFFLWGASSEQAGRDSHLWIYDTLTGYWRHRNCSGECPPYLCGSTSALIGQTMYVFGGYSAAHDNWLNCLYCLDLNTFIWRDLGSSASAEPTKPVRSDKCVGWSYKGKLFVFGGYGWSQIEHLLQLLDQQKDFQLSPDFRWPKFGWNNQLIQFDPQQNSWTWPSYSGKCPCARAAHSGALMGDKYYVFGGRDSHQRLNDLYMLDMKTLQWTQLAAFVDVKLDQPIGHLSDLAENQDQDQPQPRANDLAQDPIDHTQEEPSPSPSTSSNYQVDEDFSSASSSSSHSCVGEETGQMTDDDEFDEDDDEYTFRPVFPSRMLERWSLSSEQSSSSSSQVDGSNCGSIIQHSPLQLIEQSSTMDRAQTSSVELEQSSNVHRKLRTRPEGKSLNLRPIGRSFATFTPISNREIILYGGISSQDKELDECWLYDTETGQWRQIVSKLKQPRLWHTAARSKNNEVVIIGGSNSTKVDEFCSDVISISLEPKSLKRLAIDTAAKSLSMRSIQRVKRLPPTIYKLIKLRKQAIALTIRRQQARTLVVSTNN